MGPVRNVQIHVLGHPEFGWTVTREDGQFSMLVNGGGPLTLRFTKKGFLEAQRQVTPPPNDFISLDDVALIGGSARETVVDSGAVFVSHSRLASDANGDRDLRVVFPKGTVATVTPAGSSGATFATKHVRTKEFTVGSGGPTAMPGTLPPSSAYTYCVNLRLDEADSMTSSGALASSTQFSKYLGCYTKNFLHLPIGSAIPVGFYDETVGLWKASDDGYVVHVLAGAVGSSADSIDSQGTGHGDSSTRLAALHVSSDELVALKSEYSVGDTLVRFSANHFTTYDANPGVTAFLSALVSPAGRGATPQGLMSCPLPPSTRAGSVIECENRVLGEAIPLVGSPYTLNYRSFRASGDSAVRTVRVPVIGSTVPDSLQQIIVRLDVAGQILASVLNKPITGNSTVSLAWNGLDAFGRVVPNSVSAKLSIGYVYDLKYVAGISGLSFGNPAASGASLGAATGDRKIGRTVWSRQTISLGAASTGSDGLGGWTISPHHFFDYTGQGAVYLGDGSIILGGQLPLTVSTYAGGNASGCNSTDPDGQQVNSGSYPSMGPGSIVAGADGSLYVADNCHGAILNIDRAGVIHRLAGTSMSAPYSGDTTTVATSVQLKDITGLALAPDSSIYIALNGSNTTARVVLRLGRDHKLHKVIGGNPLDAEGSGGDGGPAGAAWIGHPVGLALAPDGSLFISDHYSSSSPAINNVLRVRRIGPDGTITGYAGRLSYTVGNDSTGVATGISLANGGGGNVPLATDLDGNLYIVESDNAKIRKVAPDGIMTTFVEGTSLIDPGGHNRSPYGIAFGPDGSAYVAGFGVTSEYGSGHIWRRDPDGTISTIAGGPIPFSVRGTGADGSLARGAEFTATTVAVTADGSLYFDDGDAILRASRALGTVSGNERWIPSSDGSEVYYFDATSGRHLRTRDGLTGAVRYSFRYNSAGQLLSIKDLTGDSTVIQRDTNGNPIGIVGPFGHRTKLSLSGTDLASVTDTLSETYQMTCYSGTGLLNTFEDPNGNVHTFDYETDGRLKTDLDPNPPGGTQSVSKPSYSGTTRTVEITSGEGHKTDYSVSDQYSGSRQQSVTEPAGQVTTLNDSTNAKLYGSYPNGMSSVTSFGRDPRAGFGFIAPIAAQDSVVLPVSGKKLVISDTRTIDTNFAMPQPAGKLYDDVVINGRSPFHTEFNATNLTLTATTPEGRRTTTTVDSAGRPVIISVLGIANDTHIAYDTDGRDSLLTKGTEGWRYSYDVKGRLATIRDTLGRVTSFQYDSADRLTRKIMPDSTVVAYHYDSDGNLDSLTTPTQRKHQFTFNGVNQTASYIPPGLGGGSTATSYFYDSDRALTKTVRPDGDSIVVGYDTYGRLGTVSIPRGQIGVSYKTSGQIDTLGSPDAVRLTYTYDGAYATQEASSGRISGTVSVTLDSLFRPATQQVNGGSQISFRYDNDGLLAGAGVDSLRCSPSSGLPDSSWLDGLTATTKQDYSANGELQNLHYTWSGVGGSFLESYARDALGRITTRYEAIGTDTVRTFGYVYWNSGRLKDVTRSGKILQHFEYDDNGNRTLALGASLTDSASTTIDAQDRMLRHGNTTYSYSANGELAAKISGADTTVYTYDEFGNLVSVMLPSHSRIDYLIDGWNRRVGRKINGHELRMWLYQDQLSPVAELDSTGAIVARYVYGSRANVPDYMVKGGKTYRLVTDHLGSVRMVVRADTALVAERIDYDAWGNIIADSNGGLQMFGFAGGLYDQDTRLTRFGTRDYDANSGRWTCKDPVIFAGRSLSLFNYCADDPVNGIDSDGLSYITFDGSTVSLFDDDGTLIIACEAISGNAHAAPLPIGKYLGSHLHRRTRTGMVCPGQKWGWSLDLAPQFTTKRTDLRLHPDPPPRGTAGCIGVNCDCEQQFYGQLLTALGKSHTPIPVTVKKGDGDK
jgi:RHS repeat-associated protein